MSTKKSTPKSTMDLNHHILSSPSPSSPSSSSAATNHHHHSSAASDPMQTWWESISKARTRIQLLISILSKPDPDSNPTRPESTLSSLADSDRPARSLLLSPAAYSAVSAAISAAGSGGGDDKLCHWLYDTFLSSDPDLRRVVLSFLPLLTSLYLHRIHSPSPSPSLSGFEAVLLAVYSSEVKLRGGKSEVISIPDVSKPSLYHKGDNGDKGDRVGGGGGRVGVMCGALEAQVAVKSTKRAGIVGVGLDCYYKQISHMPSWSKVEFCRFVEGCAGKECSCCFEFDQVTDLSPEWECGVRVDEAGGEIVGVVEGMGELGVAEEGVRIPMPWELFQPILRILGHCLLGPLNSEDVKDAASVAVRRMYARACHELNPQGILATRSLIRLDRRSRESAQASALVSASSNANTPSKAKKPEVLLVSK